MFQLTTLEEQTSWGVDSIKKKKESIKIGLLRSPTKASALPELLGNVELSVHTRLKLELARVGG